MNKDSLLIILFRAWKLLDLKYKKSFILILIGICINSLLEIIGLAAILPIMAATLKDGFIHENEQLNFIYHYFSFTNPRSFVFFLCALLLAVIVIKNSFGLLIQKKQFEYCWNIHENIASKVLNSGFSRGFNYFTRNNSNKIFNDIAGIPVQFARQSLAQILLFLNEVFVLLLIVVSLLAYDALILLLLSGIIIPVFLAFYSLSKSKISGFNRQLNDLNPQINKPVFELAFGYVDVVIAGVLDYFKSIYIDKHKKAKNLRVKLLVIQNIPNRLIEICVILAVIIIVLYSVFSLDDNSSIIVLLSVFGLAAYRTVPSVNRLINASINIKGQEYCLDILESFIGSSNPSRKNPELNISDEITFTRSISLVNLGFQFDGAKKPLLTELNLEIQKGETIGLAGKSGAGKTTLMNLMLGFLRPGSGQIKVDDVELTDGNITLWQKKIGYVRQDVFLIDESLLSNVAFGIPAEQVDLNKFNEVIGKSQLNEVVQSLDGGANGKIGERGSKLSGGQRQRVGIARALYQGAEVLFFDEATSALDHDTEEEITQSIRQLKEEKITMIIIAHRESTLRYCDRVFEVSIKGLTIKA